MSNEYLDIAMEKVVKQEVRKVLEQIRAEIEQTADEEQKHDEKWAIGLRYAIKIIDKYKAENEEMLAKAENEEMLARICGVADAWQQIQGEHKINQLTDDQFDFVTDITLDRIRKIIAEREKA